MKNLTKTLLSLENDITFRMNPLPDMPIFGSSNSMANKDIMKKIWTNGDTVI